MQITRTTLFRLIILQFLQYFLTEAFTFIRLNLIIKNSKELYIICVLFHYLARKVIRALVKSYGVKSTVTLSPGKILI